ncbi:Short-chain-enoyl-CoA hydratase [Sulfitobacter sp. DSM 110093]|uniref:enoyl-CoA hydratase/isomerase family protein n=1 Tax=Sulfitobacter sp. DSM 110093 TaxID=2883127 RepID=UPI001FABF67F|nr:enoyl-CoA hydratase-related protein [Sulfitobacter sp. DSM 110093]UOA33116.1 Short-chain-enoyl-CoA hydratase [Sulfitobacter sp. DSM 110093]
MSDNLTFNIDENGVALITLNRPKRLNAFTFEMIDAWHAALLESKSNPEVKVIVITGAGKAFCSGGDIVEMVDRLDQTPAQRKAELFERIQRIPLALEDMDKPVIAAMNGAAAGAGLDLALMCDLRIAARSAKFGETYTKVGIVPGAGGAWFLPRLVGTAKALELFWTAEFLSAEKAEEIGMVNRVVDDADLMNVTYAMARKIAASPQQSVRMIKRAVLAGMRSDLRTHLDMISSHYAIVTSGKDHQEAVVRFVEKRS